jgi:hypothetical protein
MHVLRRSCRCRTAVIGVAFTTFVGCSGSGAASSARQADDDSARVIPAAQSPRTGLARARDDTNTLVVYKSATCGCCKNWVEHMRHAGFTVVVHDTDDVQPVKDESGVPTALRSCHTALVGKYVIEGHVPAPDVRRLLRERPAVAGLAVPGMPAGSPGMEAATSERYDVMTFGGPGAQRVYASH